MVTLLGVVPIIEVVVDCWYLIPLPGRGGGRSKIKSFHDKKLYLGSAIESHVARILGYAQRFIVTVRGSVNKLST